MCENHCAIQTTGPAMDIRERIQARERAERARRQAQESVRPAVDSGRPKVEERAHSRLTDGARAIGGRIAGVVDRFKLKGGGLSKPGLIIPESDEVRPPVPKHEEVRRSSAPLRTDMQVAAGLVRPLEDKVQIITSPESAGEPEVVKETLEVARGVIRRRASEAVPVNPRAQSVTSTLFAIHETVSRLPSGQNPRKRMIRAQAREKALEDLARVAGVEITGGVLMTANREKIITTARETLGNAISPMLAKALMFLQNPNDLAK